MYLLTLKIFLLKRHYWKALSIFLYKGRHIPVAPGELLSLDKQNGSFSRQKVQASQYKSWTEGRVEYDKITLNELAVRLSRKYDVQIHLGDDLEKKI